MKKETLMRLFSFGRRGGVFVGLVRFVGSEPLKSLVRLLSSNS